MPAWRAWRVIGRLMCDAVLPVDVRHVVWEMGVVSAALALMLRMAARWCGG